MASRRHVIMKGAKVKLRRLQNRIEFLTMYIHKHQTRQSWKDVLHKCKRTVSYYKNEIKNFKNAGRDPKTYLNVEPKPQEEQKGYEPFVKKLLKDKPDITVNQVAKEVSDHFGHKRLSGSGAAWKFLHLRG